MVPPFKDYMNNLHTYQYLQQLEHHAEVPQQPRHSEISQQNSSSTDEGCDTDHGGERAFRLQSKSQNNKGSNVRNG